MINHYKLSLFKIDLFLCSFFYLFLILKYIIIPLIISVPINAKITPNKIQNLILIIF